MRVYLSCVLRHMFSATPAALLLIRMPPELLLPGQQRLSLVIWRRPRDHSKAIRLRQQFVVGMCRPCGDTSHGQTRLPASGSDRWWAWVWRKVAGSAAMLWPSMRSALSPRPTRGRSCVVLLARRGNAGRRRRWTSSNWPSGTSIGRQSLSGVMQAWQMSWHARDAHVCWMGRRPPCLLSLACHHAKTVDERDATGLGDHVLRLWAATTSRRHADRCGRSMHGRCRFARQPHQMATASDPRAWLECAPPVGDVASPTNSWLYVPLAVVVPRRRLCVCEQAHPPARSAKRGICACSPARLAALRDPARRPPVPRQEIAAESLQVDPARCVALTVQQVAEALRSTKRRAAPGLSGATAEHSALEDAGGVYSRCNSLPRAQVPAAVADALALPRLTDLRKPNGGVRGIATGDVLRRLASRVLARTFADVFDRATRPYQYALNTRAGTDALAAVLCAAGEMDPQAVVVSLDGCSALR